jgi:hypothetical protein
MYVNELIAVVVIVADGEEKVIPTSALQKVCQLELKSYQSCKTFE